MIYCDWSSFKNLYNIKKISPQYVEDVENYHVHLFDGPAQFYCQLPKGTADATEFVTLYLSLSNQRLVDPSPFAKPEFRTKRSKTSSIVSIEPNTNVTIDYLITEERYVSGGSLVFTGAEIGDYITASVYDKDGIIPELYRNALCEAWPIVGEYVPGEWIQRGEGRHEINTYPLNAKITPGFYLRITYHATNIGSTRKVGVNYYLTKKL
jgi:hypothetical protein